MPRRAYLALVEHAPLPVSWVRPLTRHFELTRPIRLFDNLTGVPVKLGGRTVIEAPASPTCATAFANGIDRTKEEAFMNWTLEVVVVPVSDVDRAKTFYVGKLGFIVDHDTKISDEYHFVQLTPPGSGCSIVLGKGVVDMTPGSLNGLQLVVKDIYAARAQLVERGLEVGEVQVLGASGSRPARDGEALNNVGFVFFSDPDGNGWAVQQIDSRD